MEGKLSDSFYKANITLLPKPDRDPEKKKTELQANTPDEYGCKNYQQDTSKSNSTAYKKELFTMIKWDSFLGCRAGSIFTNQSM